jgi:predicted ATP-dependent Lon-type protease
MIEIQPRDTSRGHFYVSLAKSALRIVAGGNLVLGNLFWAGTLLILAEVLGIVEELV